MVKCIKSAVITDLDNLVKPVRPPVLIILGLKRHVRVAPDIRYFYYFSHSF